MRNFKLPLVIASEAKQSHIRNEKRLLRRFTPRNDCLCNGFTLAELLMAVWVMSIILAAVAALSFALGSANDSVENNSEIYSRIRYTTLRLGEIVKNCKLICDKYDNGVTIWRADDNGDNQIDPSEKDYIQYDANNNCLKLNSTVLVNNCSYVNFTTDRNCPPWPLSKKLNIFFGIQQKGVVQNYQITEYLRCQAVYLLDPNGQIVASDDDF